MRFVCETCQTRYIIPDERARGRVLKVRCKKCSNVIVLRLEEGGAGESTRRVTPKPQPASTADETRVVAPADLDRLRQRTSQAEVTDGGRDDRFGSPTAAPEESAEWHVIVGGQQLGPLPLSGVIEKMASGQMDGRTYLWRDPMPEWKRASQVGEIARWLPASKTPVPVSRSQPPRQRSAGGTRREALREEPEGDWEALGIAGTPEADNDPAVESFFREAEARNSDPAKSHSSGATQVVDGRGRSDPFARVADAPGMAKPEPTENTKFLITQARIHRSPWRIVSFIAVVILLLVGAIFALSRLGVRLPLLPHREVVQEQQHVFSGEAESDDRSIRDKLIGRRRDPGARVNESPRPSPSPSRSTSGPIDEGPLARKEAQRVEKLQENDKEKLRQLYQNQQLEELHVKTPVHGPTPAIDRSDAPLTPQQVSATVSRFESGYNICIDRELKRNPGFRGGKIRIVTTIMSSGLVKHAVLVADDERLQKSLNSSPLGSCLTEQTRRMVFPNFQGEPFDAEIPLVLGASL
jgi:predicted Zn finger-like uncharacterized protein